MAPGEGQLKWQLASGALRLPGGRVLSLSDSRRGGTCVRGRDPQEDVPVESGRRGARVPAVHPPSVVTEARALGTLCHPVGAWSSPSRGRQGARTGRQQVSWGPCGVGAGLGSESEQKAGTWGVGREGQMAGEHRCGRLRGGRFGDLRSCRRLGVRESAAPTRASLFFLRLRGMGPGPQAWTRTLRHHVDASGLAVGQ